MILVLTPCQYASGKEIEYAHTIPGVSRIVTPKEYQRWFFFNRKPAGLAFHPKGIVIFLGGDFLHAVVISRKLRYPAVAYLHDRIGWKKSFKKFFVPDDLTYQKFKNKGLGHQQLKITGDLMAAPLPITTSAAAIAQKNNLDLNQKIVAFLPGSRTFQLNFMVPFFMDVVDLLVANRGGMQFIFSVSPFTEISDIQKALPRTSRLVTERGLTLIVTGLGNRILVAKEANYETISLADLCITIPGTNTAQLASLGKPMIMVLPLNRPDDIPIEGLLYFITKIPWLGRQLKKALAKMVNARVKFFALPNIKAQQELIPELRGILQPVQVAQKIIEMLQSPHELKTTSEKLIRVMGEKNAAQTIAKEIKSIVEEEVYAT
jgi:lipid-A-disaccharide synthase